MRLRSCYTAVFGFALGLCTLGTGWAEVFHFVDRDGVFHFTNVPTDSRYKRLFIGKSLRRHPNNPPGQLSLIMRTIEQSAERHQIEPALVKAVIKAESDFDPLAISSAGAMGLMQLMPSTADRWAVSNPMDPIENIGGGVRYLRHLLDLFDGNLPLVLAAYHAGEERVQQHGDIPPIPATRQYVQRVLKYYKKYQGPMTPRSMIYKITKSTGDVIYTDNPDWHREGPAGSREVMRR